MPEAVNFIKSLRYLKHQSFRRLESLSYPNPLSLTYPVYLLTLTVPIYRSIYLFTRSYSINIWLDREQSSYAANLTFGSRMCSWIFWMIACDAQTAILWFLHSRWGKKPPEYCLTIRTTAMRNPSNYWIFSQLAELRLLINELIFYVQLMDVVLEPFFKTAYKQSVTSWELFEKKLSQLSAQTKQSNVFLHTLWEAHRRMCAIGDMTDREMTADRGLNTSWEIAHNRDWKVDWSQWENLVQGVIKLVWYLAYWVQRPRRSAFRKDEGSH